MAEGQDPNQGRNNSPKMIKFYYRKEDAIIILGQEQFNDGPTNMTLLDEFNCPPRQYYEGETPRGGVHAIECRQLTFGEEDRQALNISESGVYSDDSDVSPTWVSRPGQGPARNISTFHTARQADGTPRRRTSEQRPRPPPRRLDLDRSPEQQRSPQSPQSPVRLEDMPDHIQQAYMDLLNVDDLDL